MYNFVYYNLFRILVKSKLIPKSTFYKSSYYSEYKLNFLIATILELVCFIKTR